MGAREISARIADGASIKPGKLTFDTRLKMATASKTVAAPAVARQPETPVPDQD